MLPFYSPWKHQKNLSGLLTISSGMEKEKWRVNNKLSLR